MPLPRWVARLNARFTNRFVEPIVRHLRHFSVVHHVGRESGRGYRTPLVVFEKDGTHFVALTYGPGADWVQNVLAGPATLEEKDGSRHPIVDPEVVARTEGWEAIGPLYRLSLRILRVRHLLRFETGRRGGSIESEPPSLRSFPTSENP